MTPEPRSTPTTNITATESPIAARPVAGGRARVSRTADVVLARLIADEASFARRVHRSREETAGHRAARTSFLGRADAEPEHLS